MAQTTPVNLALDDALRLCGVSETTLTPREKEAVDEDGYVLFEGVLDADRLKRLRSAFEAACGEANRTLAKDSGTRHADLVNADPIFESIYTHLRVVAVVYHVLRSAFRLGQMNGRDPLSGYGQQGLHADWMARARGEPFRIVTAIWLLDDFQANNGATRVVPGTHKLLTPPPKNFAEPARRHPEQKIIVGTAGSALVFNGHLWHSGTQNLTNHQRRVIQCSYVGRDEYRFTRVSHNSPEKLSPAARYVLGV